MKLRKQTLLNQASVFAGRGTYFHIEKSLIGRQLYYKVNTHLWERVERGVHAVSEPLEVPL